MTIPTDPADPADRADPAHPVDPVDPVDPADRADPAHPVDPAEQALARRRRPGRTLRARLVITQVSLMAVVSIVIGLASVLFLKSFLVDRLDQQLQAANHRATQAYGDARRGVYAQPGPPQGPGQLQGTGQQGSGQQGSGQLLRSAPPPLPPGQGIGTLWAVIPAGSTQVRGWVSTEQNIPGAGLTAVQNARLATVPVDNRTHIVDLGDSFGAYLVIATSGAVSRDTFITGLPLREVDETTLRLALVIAVVALLGLLAAGGAGAATVRLALRPLRRVSATARRVTQLPLDRGEVALAVRVPQEDTDARTEVGQVGLALNRMLEHVASALQARQDSEMRVRRFVADASHELRTPLSLDPWLRGADPAQPG